MVFSNLVFLFAFLPIVLIVYFAMPSKFKNLFLLIVSLFFYAWGEPVYIYLMILSSIINYLFGLLVGSKKQNPSLKKFYLTLAVLMNLGILGYYKYSTFLIENINLLFGLDIAYEPLPLPIGISFFTFQAMSYVIDVYRNDAKVQKNILDLALYIALFPQLVAGPIVRYTTVAEELKKRVHSVELFADGVRRFILGLGKKVIIANPLGEIADTIFATNTSDLSVTTVWIGIIAYSLQIYFDFSGYSDMAIGLGKMFGFKFLENFNYPYIARSVSEFWRRWHISLSSWFRDYIYIPLGGNRKGEWKTYRNLLIVWTATGFWHGASWTFMAWGFYYGIIICIERLGFGKVLEKMWRPVQHLYVLILVMIGWVFFRADNFTYSLDYIQTMFGLKGVPLTDSMAIGYLYDSTYLIVIGLLISMPIYPWITKKMDQQMENGKRNTTLGIIRYIGGPILYFALILLVTMFLVNSTYNPFIYFRF
ncbi:MBOAT family O-acyltransferase [Lysinibacillus antri]|uniref:MBOAT family protein n=1 Tax=Lysinibacillus antri TaxID=2498145 RepID=A0A3S0R564_9BACI|nr:MBOAT family protein [Lysinibacillus antri]RUL49816.1 MBOAT family protein [Lysinibacillus antri]